MSVIENEKKKERMRRRINDAQYVESFEYIPAIEIDEYPNSDKYQLCAIYVRVSTKDADQTSSFELQKTYYDDFIKQRPKWKMFRIYSDEGISGTTMAPRKGMQQMLEDAATGKFHLIIVKSISRFARNVVEFLTTTRWLKERKIGVLFESEGVYSLNENNRLSLSMLATMAENESYVRSRSMEASLRMRLDHGLPLTPELLGFYKDENGKLVINPETYKIPKLMFYMYLYGYSTQQIADYLILLSKKSYLGNMNWTAGGVARILRSERYCGDVQTRKRFKVFAPDAGEQKTFKNRGEKPISYYRDDHKGIISRDDFVAVQHIMDNAKFGGTSLLPELKVIPEGLLKGFVVVHPRWGSFTKEDYIEACRSVCGTVEEKKLTVQLEEGAFDLRGYEVVDFKLFDDKHVPAITLHTQYIKFSMSCIRKMDCGNYVEVLVHPLRKLIAVRPTVKENRNSIEWATGNNLTRSNRPVACRAFIGTLFDIFGWNKEYRYKLYGCVYRDGADRAAVFSELESSVYIRREQFLCKEGIDASGKQLGQSGKCIRAMAGGIGLSFGQDYYQEKTIREMAYLTKEQWQTRIEGQLCSTKGRLNVTPYDELRAFIQEELGELFEEVQA